jgi:hypothetical protein
MEARPGILVTFCVTTRSICSNLQYIKKVKRSRYRKCEVKAWSGPEGSRKLRYPDFMTTAQDGGKVVSLTHRPPLPLRNTRGTNFC